MAVRNDLRAPYGVGRQPIVIGPTLVRWGSIVGAAVVAIALFLLLSTLWSAIAMDGEDNFVGDNLEWFAVLSAGLSLAVAGFLSGFLSGLRGVGPGVMNGLATWGLFATITLFVGAPSALERFDQPIAVDAIDPSVPLWAAFWALLVALAAALVFGAIGGMMTRPGVMFDTLQTMEQRRDDEIDLTRIDDESRASYRTPTPGA